MSLFKKEKMSRKELTSLIEKALEPPNNSDNLDPGDTRRIIADKLARAIAAYVISRT